MNGGQWKRYGGGRRGRKRVEVDEGMELVGGREDGLGKYRELHTFFL